MLEKQREVGQKAIDKVQKACDELLRERDAIHKELKKTESMLFLLNARILIRKLVNSLEPTESES